MKKVIQHDVDIMQDASEIVHYNNHQIPIYIMKGCLSIFPNYRALAHWHEDIELIYIIKGEMTYYINGKNIELKEKDVLFVNSKNMHFGYSNKYEECEYLVILFHPILLSSNQYCYNKYIKSFIECKNIEFIRLFEGCPNYDFIVSFIVNSYKNRKETGFELEFIGQSYFLFQKLFIKYETYIEYEKENVHPDILLQKDMVSYIYQNYADNITLEDIAQSVAVSRSKCCKIFKQYLQQSPIDFLIAYRLEVSCYLLTHSDMSISEIAISCGFNSFSYFSKMFLRKYNQTPKEYRKSALNE